MKQICPNCGQWFEGFKITYQAIIHELEENIMLLEQDGIGSKNLALKRLENLNKILKLANAEKEEG